MVPNKIIITSVVIYIILLIIMQMDFFSEQFINDDAAGRGMAKGLGVFYRLLILFTIAIIITIVNAFFFRDVTNIWVKLFFSFL